MALFGGKATDATPIERILSQAGAAWWSLLLDGNAFSFSENLRNWLKPGAKSLTLNDYLEALSARDRQLLAAKLQAQAVNQEPFSLEHELSTAAEGKKFLRLQVQLETDAAGKPARIHGLVIDIGFESADRRVLGQVRNATEFMDTGILLLNHNQSPIWANPAFTEQLGYTVNEFSGLNPFELLQGESLTEAAREGIKQDLATGNNVHAELRLTTKYGEATWMQVDGRPQVDHEGTLLGYAIVFKDINELKAQQAEIEEQKQDILDSIRSARRIQAALLPDDELVQKTLPQHFLIYQPRDIVSGDFYYLFPLPNGEFVFAVVDCTGHGVPGAFMSALGHTNLNEVIRGMLMEGATRLDPGEVLRRLDKRIRFFLGQDKGTNVNEGMDVCLVTLTPTPGGGYAGAFSGANRPLYHATGGEIVILETTKLPIGGYSEEEKRFETRTFTLAPGEWIYLFTDGFPDQFGGPQHRKLGTKRLREMLLELTPQPAAAQYQSLTQQFSDWMGQTAQIDDVLLAGISG